MKMSIKDFIKSMKQKRKNRKAPAIERKANLGAEPLEYDPGEIDPPETRFTPEYRAFLEAQQAREEAAAREAEAFREAQEAERTEDRE